jgi:hypothetical protein
MTPIPEELGQTAREVVGAFKSSPVVFAILLFNVAFMIMLSWNAHEGATRWQSISEKILQVCGPHT